MSNKENLYDILGVDINADSPEIKKAFFIKLKSLGGPEKSPDQYRIIREAYDTLTNPNSRKEYDSMSKYGDEINKLVEDAELILNDESREPIDAIPPLKKAVVLGPNIARVRNLLGLAFLYSEQFENAQTQFKKAISIDDSSSLYLYNLGTACKRNSKISEAEEAFKECIELDPHTPANYIALAYLYFDNNRKSEAYGIIDKAIHADGKIDFNDFSYFYTKINMLMIEGKTNELMPVFNEVANVATTPDDRGYAAWMFVRFATELQEHKLYDLMEFLTDNAIKLEPENTDYKDYHSFIHKNASLGKEFEKIRNDKNIDPALCELVRVYSAELGGFINESEFKKQIDEVFEILNMYIGIYPDASRLKSSVLRLRDTYPTTYLTRKDVYDHFINSITSNYHTYRGKCPLCKKYLNTDYGSFGYYTCPHCYKSIKYDAGGFKRGEQTSSKSSGDCFVITAIYQDPSNENVLLMRQYRDKILSKYKLGIILIKLYYRIGPKLAILVSRVPALKKKLKTFLENRIINHVKNKINDF